jgi:mono/diheme cytochrome c family protein
MKPQELLARILIMLAVVGVVGTTLSLWARTPLIHARIAENGGWSSEIIRARVGTPLHLRFTSDDVMHGFAIGQMEMDAVNIEPGKLTELEITFDRPGTYTFYCTRWCGVNHWRMRGIIEVEGSAEQSEAAQIPPYVTLGLDIDAAHNAPATPAVRASATRGEQVALGLDLSALQNTETYRANSPYQMFARLGSTSLSESEKWDVVSYIWRTNTTARALSNGQQLYAQNCAACHGESGDGNGVFADRLAQAGEASMQSMAGAGDMMVKRPSSFTDPSQMLGASPALLHGKILRGGMGSGMPMWGSILTDEQIWELVSYLYSFQFDYAKFGAVQ